MTILVGKQVGPVGYGMMSMSITSLTWPLLHQPTPYNKTNQSNPKKGLTWNPNPPSREQSFAALDKALAEGANFWNGGELYGTPEFNSLHLLKEYFEARPGNAEKVVLSIKGGLKKGQLVPDGSEENLRRSVKDSLTALGGTKKIDIFEAARIDPNVGVVGTVKTLKSLVDEGLIGSIGLSEVDADDIKKAWVIGSFSLYHISYN